MELVGGEHAEMRRKHAGHGSNHGVAPILADPDVRVKFDAMAESRTERHDEQDATAWVTHGRARWGRVISAAGIKPE